ncbi:MAG: division/cell wall cluster transcriptional repressor MraZ [Candidatus Levybacteria bacterium]|nr:division/cell wall cluster transcriptional repressor MraZ [Candidatus Levybacteria bacterium]
MLIGRHDSKLDEKNRISFPYKFKKELGTNLVVTQGFEGSLIVISRDQMNLLTKGLEGKPMTNRQARDVEAFLLGSAEEVTLDNKGRFILPEHLKKYAGITLEVACLGIMNYVRIWDKKRWEDYNRQHLIKNISEITEKLSNEGK